MRKPMKHKPRNDASAELPSVTGALRNSTGDVCMTGTGFYFGAIEVPTEPHSFDFEERHTGPRSIEEARERYDRWRSIRDGRPA